MRTVMKRVQCPRWITINRSRSGLAAGANSLNLLFYSKLHYSTTPLLPRPVPIQMLNRGLVSPADFVDGDAEHVGD